MKKSNGRMIGHLLYIYITMIVNYIIAKLYRTDDKIIHKNRRHRFGNDANRDISSLQSDHGTHERLQYLLYPRKL